jgi:hypothetical protein
MRDDYLHLDLIEVMEVFKESVVAVVQTFTEALLRFRAEQVWPMIL